VWGYSPRQTQGWLYFARRRKKREAAQALSIAAMGARGDAREVSRTIKEWDS
jgi:hypothetical protein